MNLPESAPEPPQDSAREVGLWFACGLALSAALSVWISPNLDNDLYGRLAREIAGTPWLTQTNTKPFEQFLARLVGVLPGEAPALWRALGVLHGGLLFALLVRLGTHLFAGAPRGVLAAAAGFTLACPLVAQNFLPLNSVATSASALCLWLVARAEDRRRLSLVALAILALSRVDGAVLAGVLGIFEAALLWKESRREAAGILAVLAGSAALWLLVDRVSNGEWLGILGATQRYMDAAGSAPRGLGEMLQWFAGAWISNSSKALTLLAALGLAFGLFRGRSKVWLRLAAALAAHHGFLLLLGLTGKPFFYRFFMIDYVFAPLLAVLGALSCVQVAGEALDRKASAVQQWAAAGLALLLLLVPVSGLTGLASQARWTRLEVAAAVSCMEQGGPPRPGEHWAVPSRLHGSFLWHYRDAPLADLTWTDDYFARGAPRPARILIDAQTPAAGERSACTGAAASLALERRAIPSDESIR